MTQFESNDMPRKRDKGRFKEEIEERLSVPFRMPRRCVFLSAQHCIQDHDSPMQRVYTQCASGSRSSSSSSKNLSRDEPIRR